MPRLRPQSPAIAVPRCATSSASRIASSTTGPARSWCARRSPDARGSGTQRTYSYRDLVRLKVVKSLLDAGVKLQTARKAIEYLREDLGDDWASASLVLNGSDSVLARTDDALVDLVRRGQGVLNIVPLGHVVQELEASIHAIAPSASASTRTREAQARARTVGGG